MARKVLERYSPTEMLFLTYLAMFVIMTPLTLAQEPKVFVAIPHFTLQTWIGLALLTFFHNYLSMVLFLKALKQLDAIQAALSNYLITFFGGPIAAIWLKKRLTFAGNFGRSLDSRQHTGDHRFGKQNSEGYATVPEPQ